MADRMPPAGTSPSNSPWPMVVVVAVAVVAGAAILFGFYVATAGRGTELNITSADRAVLVTVGDLNALGESIVIRDDAIVESKTRYRNGRVELLHKYGAADGASELFLNCTLVTEPSDRQAIAAYRAQRAAGPETSVRGCLLQRREGPIEWGTATDFGVLIQSGRAVGGYLLCRRGQKVYCLEIYGAGMEDIDQFALLVGPYLERSDYYQP